ncbi:MAG: protein kinase, partial [Planctomycetota bacterium]
IQIFEVGQVGTTHYFAMELVEGRPLDVDTPRDRQGILMLARIARDAARGLAHAHEKGVIHRDIKPGNLLVDRSGRVVVTDFGLARLTDSASLTSTDAIVGTPKYMSPEQILVHAQRPVDGRADVYSLSATLYHLAAGRPPFDAPSVQAFIKAILEERPPSPRRFNRQIPHDLATIILRCLEKNPDDRYSSAGELADDLDRFLAGERILAKPRGLLALATDAVRRHRVAALGIVTALAVGLVLIAGGRAAKQELRADFEEELGRIAANEDPDVAVQDIEELLAREPGNAKVLELCQSLYRRRAMKTLDGPSPLFEKVLEDLDRAGDKASFWRLMALVEAGRLPEARASAEALPDGDPLRALTLARVAAEEGRHADAVALLPEPAAGPDGEVIAFATLTRGLSQRALGRSKEAKEDLRIAFEKSAGSPAWLRTRVLRALGTDLQSVVDSVLRTMTALTAFADNLGGEAKFAQRLIDSVLKIANQAMVPSPTLEEIARKRLESAKGEERAVAHLLLAIAQINLDRKDLALKTLDEAEEESAPALDPYVYWVRALVLRLQGNLPQAVESAQQAIELAMALAETFPDLQPLCEHASLLAKDAPPEQQKRAAEFLREKLERMSPGVAWVSALLAGLSSAQGPGR